MFLPESLALPDMTLRLLRHVVAEGKNPNLALKELLLPGKDVRSGADCVSFYTQVTKKYPNRQRQPPKLQQLHQHTPSKGARQCGGGHSSTTAEVAPSPTEIFFSRHQPRLGSSRAYHTGSMYRHDMTLVCATSSAVPCATPVRRVLESMYPDCL